MPQLPVLSGREVVRVFESFGCRKLGKREVISFLLAMAI
jgi:hypothetical protein